MITLSYDESAGTLYWYFTEIAEGAVQGEAEAAATLLLDADGQIIGLELELDDQTGREDLTLALSDSAVSVAPDALVLTIRLFAEEPADARPLEELAVLDLDAAGSLLGVEVFPAAEFELAQRLERIRGLLVSADEEDEEAGEYLNRRDAEGAEGAEDGPAPERADASDTPVAPERADASDAPVAPERADASGILRAPAPVPNHRAGFVAIVGRPNVGKSTLLNALLGQKVAIVSPKPQTTRFQVRGVLTRPDAQLIFVDTPGIHTPKTKLGTYMVEQAKRAIPNADIVCFMVDITQPPGALDLQVATLVRKARLPKLLVLNKVDVRHQGGTEYLDAYRALGPWQMEVAISALRREGLETLLEELVRRLPPSPVLYPDGEVTDMGQPQQAAELVREQVLRLTDNEVPHGVAVEVEEWLQKETAIYARMTIYVEKESQKGILIGAKGVKLKEIGSRARPGIEKIIGQQVFLDLWVKARPNWRDDSTSLGWLGFKD